MSDQTKYLKEKVVKKADEISDQLREIGHKIHQNPELLFEEYRAVQWLTEQLENHDFKVEKNVAGLETAFRATCPTSSKGPKIAFLCEYDALPELGHGCGHNLIAVIGLGAGLALCSVMDGLRGEVKVIGTPAEEGGGGKIEMIDAGVFDDLDAAMMVHPDNETVIGRGSLGIQEVKMNFYGESAHASSNPEEGINALDAAILTYNNINAFRQYIKDGARIHGVIEDSGEKPNIVPSHASARFYVRAKNKDYLETLLEKVEDCAKAGALASGANLEFDKQNHSCEPMAPNPVLVDLFERNITLLGEELEEHEGGMGSTDMGNVSQIVPSIHGYIDITEGKVPKHSKGFVKASDSEKGYRSMETAIKTLAMVGVDLLSDEKLIKRMWDKFEK